MSNNIVLALYKGDTWVIPVTLVNPAVPPSTETTPVDLTGSTPVGHLLVGSSTTPIAATAQSSTMLLSNGQTQFVIPQSVTATVPGDPIGDATRFQIVITDASGNSITRGVIHIRVLVP